jgi:hypothetical protein
MRWAPKWVAGEEWGRRQKEGRKIRGRRRQCKAWGGHQVRGRAKTGEEDKRKEGECIGERDSVKHEVVTHVGGREKNGAEWQEGRRKTKEEKEAVQRVRGGPRWEAGEGMG